MIPASPPPAWESATSPFDLHRHDQSERCRAPCHLRERAVGWEQRPFIHLRPLKPGTVTGMGSSVSAFIGPLVRAGHADGS